MGEKETEINYYDDNFEPKKGSNQHDNFIHNLANKLIKNIKDKNPRLVLSVIGDSSSFVPKPWLTPVFQWGLIETAKRAHDCIILYKGSREKVSSLVWEAVEDYSVMNDDSSNQSPSLIRLVGLLQKDRKKDMKKSDFVHESYLNPPDSYKENYGEYHATLLEKISKEYVPFAELGLNMEIILPVLVIVVEGDLSTIDYVHKVLEKQIPVLILQGSGKAADLIAECLDEDEDLIQVKAPLLFGIYFHKEKLKALKNSMAKIKEKKQFVNVLNISEQDGTDFSDAVVNSIIGAWAQVGHDENTRPVKSAVNRTRSRDVPGEEKYNLLDDNLNSDKELSVASPGDFDNVEIIPNGERRSRHNSNSIHPVESVTMKNMLCEGKVDNFMKAYERSLTPSSLSLFFYIAYQFIQEMYSKETDMKKENFQILLKQAIIANRVDYVSVLLHEEKVEFDIKHFQSLYQVESINCRCKNISDCQHIKSILQAKAENSTDKLIDPDPGKEYQFCIQGARELCQKFLHYPKKKYKKDDLKTVDGQGTYQDLLIWSLFTSRVDLAALFWVKCDNQLLSAIFASSVLKRMASRARSSKDSSLYENLKEHSRKFEVRAIEMQDRLYQEDPEIAMELMLTEQEVWGIKISPLECAFDNAMLDFIAHSCSQRRLNKIWYKGIGSSLWDFWKNGFFCGCGCRKCGCCSQKSSPSKKFMISSFIRAPLTRFLIHYAFFLAALVCYSAFLLVELSDFKDISSMKVYEWIIYVWLFGDILEEYREVVPWKTDQIRSRLTKKGKDEKSDNDSMSQSNQYRITRYFYDFWNSLDCLSYLVTIAAITVRFAGGTGGEIMARRLYSLSLFTMYMRFLHAVLMSRTTGPKIIMIKEMLKDLFRFVGILFVFMMGVGVLYHANMYPAHVDMWNRGGWTYWRIWKIMYYPYWQIYGELFLEDFNENSTTPCTTIESEWENNPDLERCNQFDWVLIVIAALYLLISNLLLVNLVIALFSYRFEVVQANSERLWRYWRYAVIMDFRTRIPAPLNLVFRPFTTVYKCFKTCGKKDKKQDKDSIRRMERLQSICAIKCTRANKEHET